MMQKKITLNPTDKAGKIKNDWDNNNFFGKVYLRVRYPFKSSITTRLLVEEKNELSRELEKSKDNGNVLAMKNYVLGFAGDARKAMDYVYTLATRETRTIEIPLDVNGVDGAVKNAIDKFLGQTELNIKVTYSKLYLGSIKSGIKIIIPGLEEIVLAALYASKNQKVTLMPNAANDGLDLKVGSIQSNDALLLFEAAVKRMNARAKVEIEKSYPFALKIELPKDFDIKLSK
jgi:hypothetical protein